MKTVRWLVFACALVIAGHLCAFSQRLSDTTYSINTTGTKTVDTAAIIKCIPTELKYYKASGLPNGLLWFGADVIPLKAADAPFIDSASENPNKCVVLFTNGEESYLSLLVRGSGGFVVAARSGEMSGRGRIILEDLNHDGINEIVAALLCTVHEYENIYFYASSGDSLQCLNPPTASGSYTEFTGRVAWSVTDSGLVVHAYHPTEAVQRTYYLRNNTREIRQISEKQIERK